VASEAHEGARTRPSAPPAYQVRVSAAGLLAGDWPPWHGRGRLPVPLGIVALMSFDVIAPTLRLALELGAAVLVVEVLGWCVIPPTNKRRSIDVGNAEVDA
jgi:hypothetical protein